MKLRLKVGDKVTIKSFEELVSIGEVRYGPNGEEVYYEGESFMKQMHKYCRCEMTIDVFDVELNEYGELGCYFVEDKDSWTWFPWMFKIDCLKIIIEELRNEIKARG